MEAAYSNVGLDANATWREGQGDSFQKCSDKLWVKLNYLRENKHHQVGEKGKTVTVRDVIPQSRLARYGNYAYDNHRESVYSCDREKARPRRENRAPSFRGENESEPWMLPEAEREFERLTRNRSRPYDLYNGFRPVQLVEVERSIGEKYPVLAKKCQPNVVDSEETLETISLPNPFYRIEDLNQLELQMRITSTKHVWERPPKNDSDVPPDRRSSAVRGNPQDENVAKGRAEAFGNGERSPLPLPFLLLPPRPRPAVFVPFGFRNPEAGKMPLPRNFRTAAKKAVFADRRDVPELSAVNRSGNVQKVPETVIKWLDTGYPTRCQEFRAVQNLTAEFRNLRSSVNDFPDKEFTGRYGPDVSSEPVENRFLEALTRQTENLNVSRCSSSGSGKRRDSPFSNLTYSPVSSTSLPGSSPPDKTPSESDSRDNGYDDLERQAIEQWPSDESFQ